jgi:polysaccharide export outer membrane protein
MGYTMTSSNIHRIVFVSLLLLGVGVQQAICFAAQEPASNEKPYTYRLHQGDTVLVSVWRDESLRQQVVVLPDGSITLPLAGRVEVAGLTTPEAEEAIATKLRTYISDPVVTVVITATGGNIAYVLGKVMHPGTLVITGPLTVIQAISTAGGFDKFADVDNIKVIREKSGSQSVLNVNYQAIISGQDMSTNILLKAGDTVIVP